MKMDISKLYSTTICEICLHRTDVLYEYYIKNEHFKTILQNNHLALCLYCNKRMYNVERLIENVFKAQHALKLYNEDKKISLEEFKIHQPLSKSRTAHIDITFVEKDEVIKNFDQQLENIQGGIGNFEGQMGNIQECIKVEIVKDELDNENAYLSDDFDGQMECGPNETQCDDQECEPKEEPVKENCSKLKKNEKYREKDKEMDVKQIETVSLTYDECMAERNKMADNQTYKNSFFKCTDCLKGFAHKETYDSHMVLHSKVAGDYVCKICKLRKKTKKKLLEHQSIHFRHFKCSICGLIRFYRGTVAEHIKSKHFDRSKFSCNKCEKSFLSKRKLAQHRYNKHRETQEKVICQYCSKSYSSKTTLRLHLAIKHPVECSAPPIRKELTCQDCGKGFHCASNLQNHMSKHKATKDHYCVECDKTFSTATGLKNHFERTSFHVNPTEARYECEYCKKRFVLKRSMERHVNKDHVKVKPFACDLCDKKYGLLNSLKIHKKLTHEGYRPPKKYPCSLCDRIFRANAVLKEHMRTHTGERPYECNMCSATFTQSGVLRTHQKLIHLKLKRRSNIKHNNMNSNDSET